MRIILALSFSAIMATAATAQPRQPSPQDRAMQLLYQREIQAHAADLAAALQLQEQLAAATKELEDLKKLPGPKLETKAP